MKPDIGTLAGLVIARALVDKTAPDSDNLRNGWRTDALLIGDVDAFVVIKCNDPASYAQIARIVLTGAGDLPEIAVLAQIAIFRGERLYELTAEREQMLVLMAKSLQKAVFLLPDGTRKLRCQSLLYYNIGVFSDTCGRFDVAAKMHMQAAEEAHRLGDKPGEAISRFCVALCNLKDALYRCDKGEIFRANRCFYAMERLYDNVVAATYATSLQVQWAEGNLPSHMMEACIWFNRPHSDWSVWVETSLAASEKLGGVFASGADFIKAMNLHMQNDSNADHALEAIVADANNPNQTKATALLMLARRAISAGKRDVAENVISRMPEQGAQHVCAIARRMLA